VPLAAGTARMSGRTSLIAADQYIYFGFYTDAALALLRQVRHSFKF
jgi:hypothetical protein